MPVYRRYARHGTTIKGPPTSVLMDRSRLGCNTRMVDGEKIKKCGRLGEACTLLITRSGEQTYTPRSPASSLVSVSPFIAACHQSESPSSSRNPSRANILASKRSYSTAAEPCARSTTAKKAIDARPRHGREGSGGECEMRAYKIWDNRDSPFIIKAVSPNSHSSIN